MNKTFFKTNTKRLILNDQGIAHILTEASKGRTYGEIAREMGITAQAVAQVLKRKNAAQARNRDPLNKEKLFEYVEKGYSGPTIAQLMDYPVGTIYSAMHHMGLTIKRSSKLDDILFAK